MSDASFSSNSTKTKSLILARSPSTQSGFERQQALHIQTMERDGIASPAFK